MMAPVCDTRTEGAHEDCVSQTTPWWEHPASLLPVNKKVSSTNEDSTMKSDYQDHGSGLTRNTRFSAHQPRLPALGTGLCVNYIALLCTDFSTCRHSDGTNV